MSNEVHTLVKRRVVGSQTMKSVLLYMADAASDDGSGIWVSKANMALDLEFKSKRTVQTAIADMLAKGLVKEVGQRKHHHGYTIEYQINLSAVAGLPETRPSLTERNQRGAGNAPVAQNVGGAGDAPVQEVHPTGAADARQEVQEMHPNHTRTILEPCVSPEAPHTQDFNFEDFQREFEDVYPRLGDGEATEAELRAAIEAGTAPAKILAGARAYAAEQKGNKRQYIAFSENWLRAKRWVQHAPASKEAADPAKVLEFHANTIQEGKPFLCRTISAAAARECIAAGLVTLDQCREAGVQL
ncbi:hypothetical protein [Ruegeria sp. HKCCD8929]|uniref:hypothetical protein n=1 Tax=Ruegeria sp. HKCCD8929 TaxID=2683006 RepID=UPI0014880326|nr:hypothetical protein [Ruegeria sp. HKCCD8929]